MVVPRTSKRKGAGFQGRTVPTSTRAAAAGARLQSNTMPSVYLPTPLVPLVPLLLPPHYTLWQALKTGCSCVWKPWEDVVCSRYQFLGPSSQQGPLRTVRVVLL